MTGWGGVPAAVVSDCVGRFGAMNGSMRALTGLPVSGPAHTIQLMPGDNLTLHLELQNVEAGAVLVVDAGGYTDRAVWGEVLAVAAIERGILGAVIDGAVRDVAAMTALGFPLFARAAVPAGPHKAGQGRAGVPVSCGGVVVEHGDVVVGDLDGVAIVPRAREAEIRRAVHERMRVEEEWIAQIRQGVSSAEATGLLPKGDK